MGNLMQMYNGSGVFLFWDRSNTSGAVSTRISRSNTGMDGPWEEVEIIDALQTEYVDTGGTSESFYLIEEIDATDPPNVLYTHPVLWGEEILQSASLAYELGEFLNLQIWRDRVFFNRDRTQARVQYRNWVQDPPPAIEINAKEDEQNQGKQQLDKVITITETTEDSLDDYPTGLKYNLDYNGNIFFIDASGSPIAIRSYDDVWATYAFKAFSNSELNDALANALASLMSQPGICKGYTLGTTPLHWERALVSGATAFLLRRLAAKLMKPENVIPYSVNVTSPETVSQERDKIIGYARDLAKEYMDEFQGLKEKIAIERYPNISIITQPEFMLPGGRSRFFRSLFKTS